MKEQIIITQVTSVTTYECLDRVLSEAIEEVADEIAIRRRELGVDVDA